MIRLGDTLAFPSGAVKVVDTDSRYTVKVERILTGERFSVSWAWAERHAR